MLTNKLFTLMQILAVAFVYLLSSQLCSLMGVPNEFGTVIWPPAGISLACLVIFGPRLWLGVFIGAFLADLYFIFNILTTLTPLSYITAGIEAVGATLEALTGVWLMKNVAHFPNPLHTEKQIGLFIVCAFLSCFISPTVAMATLTLTNQISLNVAESHWIDWYLGDFVGMLIFTPLLIIWLHRSSYFVGRRLIVTSSVLVALMLAILLVRFEFNEEHKRLQIEFEKHTHDINAAVGKQLSGHFNSLNAIASLYNSSAAVDRHEFGLFVHHLFKAFKGIQALEFSQVVTNSQRNEFESAIRKEGFSGFHITERDKDKNSIPAAHRDRYVVVNFIEPMKGNEKVFGFDTLSDVNRKQTFNQAIDSGKLTLTSKLTLVQEHGTQSGVLAILPVYRNDVPHNTVEEKRANIQGFIVGVFRIGDMLEAALNEINHKNLAIQLYDISSDADSVVLFENKEISEHALNLSDTFNITLGERVWKMKISATKAYLENHDELSANHIHKNYSWHILLMGLIITSLIGGVALILSGRSKLLEDTIEIRTAELKINTAKLIKSEANYRTIFEDMPIGVVNIAMDGYFLDVNESFCHFTGYSLEELKKLTFMEITPPEFIEQDREIYNKLINNEITEFTFEKKYRRKDGVEVWANASVRLIFNEDGSYQKFIAAIEDIDLIKKSQALLYESEQRFQLVADAAPVLIWLSGTDSLCYWFNKVWLEFVGRTLEQEMGNGWVENVHPDDFAHCLDIYITNFNLRQPFKMEYRVKHHSGQYRWLLDTGVPRFNAQGDFEGYIGSCMDIHEMKLLQLDEQKTAQAMLEAKEAAEALAQSKTDFLANMSHEIRTPMNAILGLSELALHSEDNNEKDYLEKIHGASENLLTILNDILEFSKLDSTGIEIDSDYFNLSILVNNLNNLFEEIARQKNLTFHLVVAPDVQHHLIGDALRLQQVLTNLLNNSIKFTQTGFVRLSISVSRQDDKQTALTFSIEDSGIGISPEQQELLFQPFTQADTSITRRFGGTGLGLVISQKFIHLMGGEISLESTLNEGSRFWFTLPFEISKKSHSTEFLPIKHNKRATAAELEEAAELLFNKRVLLVEDMPLNQQVASEFLRNAKLRVVVADNGKEALDILEYSTFDIVLMDIQMPVMDGLEATRLIRDQPQYATLPIIAMSAGVTLDEQEKCQAVGMSDFIAKSINPLQMLEKIKQNLIQ
jgi:PAS domain S-box-containing protein